MKKPVFLILAAAAAVFAQGCTTVRELPQEMSAKTTEHPDEQEKSAKLLACFLKDDASGFQALLSPELQKEFGKDKFDAMKKVMTDTLGKPVSYTFLTALEHVSIRPYVWKVSFQKETKDGKQTVKSDALFRVLAGRDKDGNVLIIGFNFL